MTITKKEMKKIEAIKMQVIRIIMKITMTQVIRMTKNLIKNIQRRSLLVLARKRIMIKIIMKKNLGMATKKETKNKEALIIQAKMKVIIYIIVIYLYVLYTIYLKIRI